MERDTVPNSTKYVSRWTMNQPEWLCQDDYGCNKLLFYDGDKVRDMSCRYHTNKDIWLPATLNNAEVQNNQFIGV